MDEQLIQEYSELVLSLSKMVQAHHEALRQIDTLTADSLALLSRRISKLEEGMEALESA